MKTSLTVSMEFCIPVICSLLGILGSILPTWIFARYFFQAKFRNNILKGCQICRDTFALLSSICLYERRKHKNRRICVMAPGTPIGLTAPAWLSPGPSPPCLQLRAPCHSPEPSAPAPAMPQQGWCPAAHKPWAPKSGTPLDLCSQLVPGLSPALYPGACLMPRASAAPGAPTCPAIWRCPWCPHSALWGCPQPALHSQGCPQCPQPAQLPQCVPIVHREPPGPLAPQLLRWLKLRQNVDKLHQRCFIVCLDTNQFCELLGYFAAGTDLGFCLPPGCGWSPTLGPPVLLGHLRPHQASSGVERGKSPSLYFQDS